MALVVEDGTGLVNASSYISISFADTYHRDRANTTWAAGDFGARESAILKATEYIDSQWVFQGTTTFPQTPQALQFPRTGMVNEEGCLVDAESLPLGLQRATAEMALSILTNSGDVSPATVTGGAKKRRERVGVLESELEFDAHEGSTFFPRVSRLLAPFIIGTRPGGGSAPLFRG